MLVSVAETAKHKGLSLALGWYEALCIYFNTSASFLYKASGV